MRRFTRLDSKLLLAVASAVLALGLISCGRDANAHADSAAAIDTAPIVGVTPVTRRPVARTLTMSSELVPFQEIDVFAKESGYVSKLYVDYGSKVHAGELLAVLEIPELQAQLQEDEAAIKSASDQVGTAQHQLNRVEAQRNVYHLQYTRLNNVAESKPGLVAQQEVDDAQGKDLAAQAQVEAAKANLESVQSQLMVSQSKLVHDKALFDYSRITAPFSGVVTQRYANLGTLMQAGTTSSTAMPLVKLSEEGLYRLVIPVPETYVQYIKVGDPVNVKVNAVNRDFPGKIARFSFDVNGSTRTMHTEVDVPNPNGVLLPGVYAEATLTLDRRGDALVVPLQAVNQTGAQGTVYIVNSDDKVEPRTIVLGLQTENYVEVLSGLKEGERVVISDTSGLRPGEAVHPKAAQAGTYNSES